MNSRFTASTGLRPARFRLLLSRVLAWLLVSFVAAATPWLGAAEPVIVFQATTTADYTVANELWKTDGTTAGTALLREINPGQDPFEDFMNPGGPRSSYPQNFFALGNGRMIFSATDSANGNELWVTDGTLAGTSLVKDIRLGKESASPARFTRLNNQQVVFTADDGTAGEELWITDGTAAGTMLLKDVNSGTQGAFIDGIAQLSANKIVFTAYTPDTGRELWVTNGTAGGTVRLGDFNPGANDFYPRGYLVLNADNSPFALFFAQTPGEGKELWRTDGTLAGTELVKDIRAGMNSSIVASWPAFGALGTTRAVFPANDGTNGEELWVTDGTEAGTTMVKDLRASGDSSPNTFVAAHANNQDYVVFVADDRTGGFSNSELWITDGTPEGTVTKNINTGSSSLPQALTYDGNGKVYFSAESSSAVGRELWVTDLTLAGTVLVKDIYPGHSNSSSPSQFFSLGDGRMLFSANDGTGTTLWITNGNESETVEVSDLPSMPAHFAEITGDSGVFGLSLPTFVGFSTTLTVQRNASATDIKHLFHVSDTDSGQTLTWFESVAPAHGTLTISNATANSGDTEIIPGGTITYTPTPGYVGDDSFTLHVTDEIATDTRTITVTVSPPPPDNTPPTLSSSYPSHNDTGIPVSADLTLTFSESVQAGAGNIILRPTTGGDVSIAIDGDDVSFSGTTLTVNPPADLAYSMTYNVIIASGVIKDLANNNYAGLSSGQLTFTTGAPPLTTMTTGDDADIDAGGIDNTITAAPGTLNDGDAVAAGDGTDTLNATLADGETSGSATLSGFENLNLTVGAGHSATFNALNVTASTIKPKGAGAHIITNAKVNVDASGLAVGGTTSVTFTGTSGTLTGGAGNDSFALTQPLTTQFTINGGAGTGDSLTAKVNGASSLAPNLSNVESLTLDSTGATSSVSLSSVSGIKTITITGSAELTLTSNPSAVSSITSIAAGAFTGKLKLNIDSALATIQGGSGNDEIIVSIGNSTGLYTVKGGPGNDQLSSGNGGDTFDGEEGNDILYGGPGNETLTGGPGNDIFRYGAGNSGTDKILDFGVGEDRIDFQPRDLVSIAAGDGTNVPANGVEVGAYLSGTDTTPIFIDSNNAQDGTRIQINLIGDFTGKLGLQGGDVVYVPGPVLSATTPLDNAIDVAADANLVLTFNKAVTAVAGKNIVIRRTSDNVAVATIEATDETQVTVSGTTATIDPSVTLLHGTAYHVLIDEGAFVDSGSLPFPGIANATTLNFTTEVKAEVDAADSDALASYLANANVSTINLSENSSYILSGATISRALTIKGDGATIATGAGLLRTVVRGSMIGDYTNVPVVLEVGSGGSLTLEHVTLQNNGNQSADTGILAVINVKNGGSLTADHVTFRDFHNNVTPGAKRAFAIHAEPSAVATTVTASTFGSSNAFRSAIAIRGGEFTLTGNTFIGTAEPDRLPNDDGYEYAVYLYGGAGAVTDNTISGFDSTKQIGYTSAGVALFGAADLAVTLEDNFFVNSIDPEADASDNGHDIDITRAWKPNTNPTVTITVGGQDYVLGPTADADAAFKAGEALRDGNDTDKVAVLLDQNDEVLIKETTDRKDFAVLGGYRSNYLTVSESTPVSAKLSFPSTGDQALVMAAATALEIEQQKDDETSWTVLPTTWTGVPGAVDLALESNHIYRFRAKLTHTSYAEISDPTPRTLFTYTNPVAVDTAAPPSITSVLTASGTYGASFTYTITASNTPTSFSATGLPAGLSVDAGTGVISGTPTTTGSFDVTLTGTNNVGTGPSATLTVTIAKATATVTLDGLNHVYSGGPKSASASTTPANLPVSFSYNSSTTEPVNAGTYAVVATIDSPNYAGSASGTLMIAAASQAINFPALGDLVIGQSTTLSATATSGLPVSFAIIRGPASLSGATLTTTGIGTVTVRASQVGSGNYAAAPNVDRSFTVTLGTPVVTTPEQIPIPPVGGTAELIVTNNNPNVTYQWQRNGSNLPNGSGPSLTLNDVQPPTAGLYTYTATVPGGGGGTSEPVIVGLTTDELVIGTGTQVGADIVHPNGNVYDQVLLEGNGASVTASTNKVTRLSFVDLTNDIVQVEFSGAGTLSVVMDDASQPAPPINYNQANVDYVRGHVGLVITGANETSNLSVFSVGPVTAVNQSLFKEGVTYDGVADVAFVAIQSANGKFGGIRTGNVSYYASQGFTGVYAPGVEFAGPINIGEVTAFDSATPVLVFGNAGTVNLTGGNLEQDNGSPVTVSGITKVQFVDGRTSQNVLLPAQPNKGVLIQDGVNVTSQIVVNP